MLFKKKNKQITLDFFTDQYVIYDLFKIERTHKHKPKWLTNDVPIRHCAGLAEFLTNSFLIRSWSDIMIERDGHGNIVTSSSNPNCIVTSNAVEERGSFLPQDKYQHLKIPSPWLSRANKSIQCAFYGAAWHDDTYLSLLSNLPAIRDFYYEKNWNIHFILNKESMNGPKIIYTNDPIQYFIPLTDKKINVECHYDPDEYKKLQSYTPNDFSMTGKSYFRLKKLIRDKEK